MKKATFVLISLFAVIALGGKLCAQPADVSRDVEKALRDYYAAFAQNDLRALDYIAEDGFSYDTGSGIMTGRESLAQLKSVLKVGIKNGVRTTFEITELEFYPIGPDAVVANYRLTGTDTAPNGRQDIVLSRATDVLVRRKGRWLIFAEHMSRIPKPVEHFVAGMPIGWQRDPVGMADSYSMTVDHAVRHGGKASASIKFSCGDDQDAWASLGQAVLADDYRGKRVRLTGWLRTVDVPASGLWARIDGDTHTLAFDNMSDRSVVGTTDWKMYSVVLDVPNDAKYIHLGALLIGRGQIWVDDLKFDVVANDVSTTMFSPPDAVTTHPIDPTTTAKRPVNLGFEEGVIK